MRRNLMTFIALARIQIFFFFLWNNVLICAVLQENVEIEKMCYRTSIKARSDSIAKALL